MAAKVNLTPTLASIDMVYKGETIHISRIQDTNHKLRNEYTLTSRISPPFELQPYQVADGVQTVSELDVFTFIQNSLPKGGLFIDARLSNWHNKSTIPAAINIPFISFANTNILLSLQKLGVTKQQGKLDFSQAKDLLIFDNGPWCPQASREIHSLLGLGYPREKIRYYRGGMQYWSILGLTLKYPHSNPEIKNGSKENVK